MQAAIERQAHRPDRQLAARTSATSTRESSPSSTAADRPRPWSKRLCELNVDEQVANVAQTTIVQDAWDRGHERHVHGWIYDIHDGLLNDLGACVTGPNQIAAIYRMVLGDPSALEAASSSSEAE